jgi:preprotein translocase subunit SecF
MVLNIAHTPTHSPLKLGIDFIGGTLTEVQPTQTIAQETLPHLAHALDAYEIEGSVIQLQNPIQSNSASQGSILSIRTPMLDETKIEALESTLKSQVGEFNLLQRNTVGPTLAKELFTNALLALALAYLLITGYLTYRFQLDYALCALIALVHDTVIVFGVFAAMGYLGNVAIDSLFITGILTVIGFSVHDTIVVFDRLRENTRLLYSQKRPFAEIANVSINQTLARSINTSLTALLPLGTLYFFGGDNTKNLVLCMGLGIIVGTYSSIAIASLLLSLWREKQETALIETSEKG